MGKVLAIALLRMKVASRSRIQSSPYEILKRMPFLCLREILRNVHDQKIKELDAIR